MGVILNIDAGTYVNEVLQAKDSDTKFKIYKHDGISNTNHQIDPIEIKVDDIGINGFNEINDFVIQYHKKTNIGSEFRAIIGRLKAENVLTFEYDNTHRASSFMKNAYTRMDEINDKFEKA